MDNKLISLLFTQINKAIDNKINGLTQIKSATIPPDKTIYHNVQNQSIYRNLQPGDNVKIIIENGNLSNMWVIGKFSSINTDVQMDNAYSNDINNILNMIYPIGSIYISVNSSNPTLLFGGVWEQVEGRFLVGVGSTTDDNDEILTFTNGQTGGEAQHTLEEDELPSHTHGLQGNDTAHNNMLPYLAVYMWKRIK